MATSPRCSQKQVPACGIKQEKDAFIKKKEKKKEKDAATIISFADVVFIRLLVESTGKIFYGGITRLYG